MGGLYTSYRYYWNSKKEYDKYWHKDRKKRRIIIIVIITLILLTLIIGGLWFFNSKSLKHEDGYSLSLVESNPNIIPDHSNNIYVELNNNKPGFTKNDLENIKGESYSELDKYGRCGTAVAMLDQSMMPKEERGSIGMIKPSGWVQKKYPGIIESDPPYLYNRCHLIAYGLTGQNANEMNLITGTRYFNVNGMLPFEEIVMRYLDRSNNHVLYRVSPYFSKDELLSRGVEIEAYSVEDNGDGVCFHVFVYNIQPGIVLNYKTGESEKE